MVIENMIIYHQKTLIYWLDGRLFNLIRQISIFVFMNTFIFIKYNYKLNYYAYKIHKIDSYI